MKKIILSMIFLVPSILIGEQAEETIAHTILKRRQAQQTLQPEESLQQRKFIETEKKQKQQEEAQKLPDELVDSLIEHSPAQVKFFVPYLRKLSEQKDLDLPRRLFLYGPAGVGKTDTAKALAIKAGMPYTVVDASSCGSKYQNSAKKKLEKLLLPIINGKKQHVIIVDEITRLIENYDEGKGSHEDNNTATRFWSLLDQCIDSKKIAVIATANSIDRCPKMVLSRFEEFAKLEVPNLSVQKKILKLYMPKEYICSDKVLDQLAQNAQGLPPRVLKNILRLVLGRLGVENSKRRDLTFDDFKDIVERQKALYQEKGILSEMLSNARDSIVKTPLETLFGSIGAAGAVGALRSMFSNAPIVTKTAAPIANEVAKKTAEYAPQIVKNGARVAKFAGDNAAVIVKILKYW